LLVVGVEDRELDALVDGGVDDLVTAAGDFFAALADVGLLPTADADVVAAVLLVGPDDEYRDGELALTAVVLRLLVTERLADFVAEG